MTLEELKNILSEAFPGKVCYRAWKTGTAPDLPWVCYYETGETTEPADNAVYASFLKITIELYTEHKDKAIEAALDSALAGADIVYEKECTHLDSEKMYETIYTMEV